MARLPEQSPMVAISPPKRGGVNLIPKENQQAWLMIYSDLVTVILAFFVLLQSLSTIDPEKYEIFTAGEVHEEIVLDERLEIVEKNEAIITKKRLAQLLKDEAMRKRVQKLLRRVKKDLKGGGLSHLVAAKADENLTMVTLRIKSSLLFKSGKGKIRSGADIIIDKVSRMVVGYPNVKVNIEGHTDNVPINTPKYSSNWELSASRAVNVLQRMIENGIETHDITATGYGDSVPVNDNSTRKGRAANRRILIHLHYDD